MIFNTSVSLMRKALLIRVTFWLQQQMQNDVWMIKGSPSPTAFSCTPLRRNPVR